MRQYWIIPADPDFYDVDGAYTQFDMIDWGFRGENSSINVDDIVFIYICKPIQEVGFMTRVVRTHVPESEIIDDYQFYGPKHSPEEKNSGHYNRLEFLSKATRSVTLDMMHNCGMLGNIQSPRRLDDDLLEMIETAFPAEDLPKHTNVNPVSKRKIFIEGTTKSEYDLTSSEARAIKESVHVGDIVEHKLFGEALVTGFSDDGTKIVIKLRSGREMKLLFPGGFLGGYLKRL